MPSIDKYQLKSGDIISIKGKRFIILYVMHKRSLSFFGAMENDAARMVRDPKDVKGMRFYEVKPKMDAYPYLGKYPAQSLKTLEQCHQTMQNINADVWKQNMDIMNATFSPNRQGERAGGRLYLGNMEMTAQNGDKVGPGDVVVVQFSNGKFNCILGNKNRVLYDGKTGRVFVQPTGLYSRQKARSMPPKSILGLASKSK